MDAVTLDHLIAELLEWLGGKHLSRPRLGPPGVVTFEVSADRGRRWLWVDADRGTAGMYALERDAARTLAAPPGPEHPGRARQALLHLRKHLDGARVLGLRRVAGERTLRLDTSGGTLVLRLSGPAPALTLVRDDEALGTVGDGPEAWPLPPEAPQREWDRLDEVAFEQSVAAAQSSGRALARSVLAACPGLGPVLARATSGSASSFAALRERLRSPRPTVCGPGPPETWHDRDLKGDAVVLVPVPIDRAGGTIVHPPSWLEAAALFLGARRRGVVFERRRQRALVTARRRLRRLEQLAANLERDLAGVPDESSLRREAEALLAFGHRLRPGATEVEVPDPYEPDRTLTLAVDARVGGVGNAEKRFEKARRADRARHQVALRLRETTTALEEERRRESLLEEARDADDLTSPDEGGDASSTAVSASPRRFLTSRGLVVLVGRNARENHHLTFKVAQPEDLWFHARDVPGSHVILRDNEGRAGAEDLREAAEVAAFFSEARGEAQVDVHATRRKHVRPARGGPGRVFVGHSETFRVRPRDPERRLRRR